MKIATLILGIIGSLASFGLGSKWYTDYNKHKQTMENLTTAAGSLGGSNKVSAAMSEYNNIGHASYALLACGVIALIASLLVFKHSKVAAIILVLAAVVPAIFTTKALIATFLLFIAGSLAFFVKPKMANA